MSEQYPYPCNRCGYCCIAIQCPASVEVFGQLPHGIVCPALSFEGDMAACGLIAAAKPEFKDKVIEALGIGKGCCVKALVLNRDGTVEAFEAMPDDKKVLCVRQMRAR